MAFMSVASFDAIATAAMQDDKAPPASAASGGSANELAELGETLKAAVLSGTLSEEDAIKIYYSMARSLAPDNTKKTARAAKGSDGPYAAKLDIMMNRLTWPQGAGRPIRFGQGDASPPARLRPPRSHPPSARMLRHLLGHADAGPDSVSEPEPGSSGAAWSWLG